VVSAFEHILDQLHAHQTGYVEYEVGTGNTISIRDFVYLAKQICGNDTTALDFGAVPYRPNEPMTVNVDTSRLAALGWQPQVSVEEGLRRTFEFEKDLLQ
jgi:nucleoside-diphosphate-sugar epimerase